MPPMHIQHPQHMLPQMHMQHMGSGAWYPPPGGAGAQGMPPGPLLGQHQAGPFPGMPLQPVPGT